MAISNLDASYTNLVKGSPFVPAAPGAPVWSSSPLWYPSSPSSCGSSGTRPPSARTCSPGLQSGGCPRLRRQRRRHHHPGVHPGRRHVWLHRFHRGRPIGANTANTGFNYELDAIAACVIGGVSFVGGIGKIRGVIIGVVLLRIIFVGLTFMSVSSICSTSSRA